MATETFWHVGILVRDLDAAIEKFSSTLDIKFNEPTVSEIPGFEEPEVGGISSLRLAFSIAGPPFFELMESAGTGLFGPDVPEGIHHLGIWNPDNAREEERLRSLGVRSKGRNFLPDGCMQTLFNHPDDLHGVRLEYVNSQNRSAIENFIRTGDFTA